MAFPELLSPAGTLKSMRYAFAYGADAVYAGQPRYSLRVRNNEFSLQQLAVGIQEAHANDKRLYVVSNIAPHNGKLKTYLKDMEPVIALNPDALIMSDPGMIMLIRQEWPEIPIHLSVQANAVNWASVKFWQDYGLSRVILSRELSLEEIAQIREKVPGMELEVFVHGALCIAYSGRCLLSGYMNHRDPNQGACTNACRWNYEAIPATQELSGEVVPKDIANTHGAHVWQPNMQQTEEQILLLREEHRPNDYMPMFEDEHGTYIMNSKDLRAVQHIPKLFELGVHSLKIEGRTKSHYYVARTAQVYRQAIDNAVQGKPFDLTLMDDLENLANRGYTEGFYRRHVHDEYQNYERGFSKSEHQQFVGEVIESNDQCILIEVKNKFEVGNSLEMMTPKGNCRFDLKAMNSISGSPVTTAPGSGHRVEIPKSLINLQLDEQDLSYGLLMRNYALK